MLNRRSLLSKGLGISAVAGLALGAGVAVAEEPKGRVRDTFHSPSYYHWLHFDSVTGEVKWRDGDGTKRDAFLVWCHITARNEGDLQEYIEKLCSDCVRASPEGSVGRIFLEKGFRKTNHQVFLHVAIGVLNAREPMELLRPTTVNELAETTKILRPTMSSSHQKMWELGGMEPVYFPLQPLT